MRIAYPDAEILLTGHSLGDSVAALTAYTLNYSCVAFNAPPDRLPASSLNLDTNTKRVLHYGSEGDSIFRGRCNVVLYLTSKTLTPSIRVVYSTYASSEECRSRQPATAGVSASCQSKARQIKQMQSLTIQSNGL
jgi:putative lipase involved disintegration of autophagic bodies